MCSYYSKELEASGILRIWDVNAMYVAKLDWALIVNGLWFRELISNTQYNYKNNYERVIFVNQNFRFTFQHWY